MPLHTPSLAAAAAVIALLLALSVWLASWRPRRDALPATGACKVLRRLLKELD